MSPHLFALPTFRDLRIDSNRLSGLLQLPNEKATSALELGKINFCAMLAKFFEQLLTTVRSPTQ